MADDYNARAAKGQAINLAIQTAIHEGEHKNLRFIYAEYLRYYEIAQLIQNASIDDIKEALNGG